MTIRKKKLLLIQILIFIIAAILIYFTYYGQNVEKITTLNNDEKNDQTQNKENTSSFENIEYKGVDLNGNRYILKSEEAQFKIEKPELIKMKVMKAIFYFKDGTVLEVKGDFERGDVVNRRHC